MLLSKLRARSHYNAVWESRILAWLPAPHSDHNALAICLGGGEFILMTPQKADRKCIAFAWTRLHSTKVLCNSVASCSKSSAARAVRFQSIQNE